MKGPKITKAAKPDAWSSPFLVTICQITFNLHTVPTETYKTALYHGLEAMHKAGEIDLTEYAKGITQ